MTQLGVMFTRLSHMLMHLYVRSIDMDLTPNPIIISRQVAETGRGLLYEQGATAC